MTAVSAEALLRHHGSAMREELGERPAVCEQHGAFTSTGQRFFGRQEVWSRCPGCAQAAADQAAADASQRAAIERRERLEALLERAAVPRRFVGRDFAAYVAQTEGQAHALSVSKAYAEKFEQRAERGQGLVFAGQVGTGKSHLAAAILQAILPERVGLYVTMMGLIRMVRSTWRKDAVQTEADVLRTLSSVDLLVVDEVGVQYGTESEQTILFEVLDERYLSMLPTILLTNQDKDGFRAYVGDRTFDRLTESCRWVAFDWASHRAEMRRGAA